MEEGRKIKQFLIHKFITFVIEMQPREKYRGVLVHKMFMPDFLK